MILKSELKKDNYNEWSFIADRDPQRGGLYLEYIDPEISGSNIETFIRKNLMEMTCVGSENSYAVFPMLHLDGAMYLTAEKVNGSEKETRVHHRVYGRLLSMNDFKRYISRTERDVTNAMDELGLSQLDYIGLTKGISRMMAEKNKVNIICNNNCDELLTLIYAYMMKSPMAGLLKIAVNGELVLTPAELLITNKPVKYYLSCDYQRMNIHDFIAWGYEADVVVCDKYRYEIENIITSFRKHISDRRKSYNSELLFHIRELQLPYEVWLKVQKDTKSLLRDVGINSKNKKHYYELLFFAFENYQMKTGNAYSMPLPPPYDYEGIKEFVKSNSQNAFKRYFNMRYIANKSAKNMSKILTIK